TVVATHEVAVVTRFVGLLGPVSATPVTRGAVTRHQALRVTARAATDRVAGRRTPGRAQLTRGAVRGAEIARLSEVGGPVAAASLPRGTVRDRRALGTATRAAAGEWNLADTRCVAGAHGTSQAAVARLSPCCVDHAVAARGDLRLEGLRLELLRLHRPGEGLTVFRHLGLELHLGERPAGRRFRRERRHPALLGLRSGARHVAAPEDD